MNKLFKLILMVLVVGGVASCGSDPVTPVNDVESITSVSLTVQEVDNAGTAIGDPTVLTYSDPDGEGGNDPVVSSEIILDAFKTYEFTLKFLDESVEPGKDVTTEILYEGADHQVFYSFSGTGGVAIEYLDADTSGNPVGLHVKADFGDASNQGELTITLRHLLNKLAEGVSSGDITNAAGEDDIKTVPGFTIIIIT